MGSCCSRSKLPCKKKKRKEEQGGERIRLNSNTPSLVDASNTRQVPFELPRNDIFEYKLKSIKQKYQDKVETDNRSFNIDKKQDHYPQYLDPFADIEDYPSAKNPFEDQSACNSFENCKSDNRSFNIDKKQDHYPQYLDPFADIEDYPSAKNPFEDQSACNSFENCKSDKNSLENIAKEEAADVMENKEIDETSQVSCAADISFSTKEADKNYSTDPVTDYTENLNSKHHKEAADMIENKEMGETSQVSCAADISFSTKEADKNYSNDPVTDYTENLNSKHHKEAADMIENKEMGETSQVSCAADISFSTKEADKNYSNDPVTDYTENLNSKHHKEAADMIENKEMGETSQVSCAADISFSTKDADKNYSNDPVTDYKENLNSKSHKEAADMIENKEMGETSQVSCAADISFSTKDADKNYSNDPVTDYKENLNSKFNKDAIDVIENKKIEETSQVNCTTDISFSTKEANKNYSSDPVTDYNGNLNSKSHKEATELIENKEIEVLEPYSSDYTIEKKEAVEISSNIEHNQETDSNKNYSKVSDYNEVKLKPPIVRRKSRKKYNAPPPPVSPASLSSRDSKSVKEYNGKISKSSASHQQTSQQPFQIFRPAPDPPTTLSRLQNTEYSSPDQENSVNVTTHPIEKEPRNIYRIHRPAPAPPESASQKIKDKKPKNLSRVRRILKNVRKLF